MTSSVGATSSADVPAVEGRVIGVAIAVPEPYGSELQEVREKVGDENAEGIPTHVTLLPPTTVDGDLLPEIAEHLQAVAAAMPPFTMRLRGTGTFRPVSPVVFVSLTDGISACERLENAVRSGVLWRSLHFNYHPHVTIAHGLPDETLDEALEQLVDYDVTFTVDGFSLYEHVDERWLPRQHFGLTGPRTTLGAPPAPPAPYAPAAPAAPPAPAAPAAP